MYQREAMSFRLPTANAHYALYNLAGEVGELFSLEAKGVRDGYKGDFKDNVQKELGDILWHVAAIAHDYGFSLGDVAWGNIAKLSDRAKRNVIQGSGDNR